MASSSIADLFARPTRRAALRLAGLGVGVALAGCAAATPEPRRIKWGRDTCEFCHMTFADRRFAAEIWDPEQNRARLYDDFGCAVLAGSESGLVDRADVAFWVTDDAAPEVWLDARQARYRGDAVTPMGYGHSAGRTPAHRLEFRTAVAAIRDKAACEHRA
jgi:nitrous oxide reductase accessory protein NosL